MFADSVVDVHGTIDQSNGRLAHLFSPVMMYQDEVTIADRFQAAGYATGMFGKWHLGDHYPYRAQDRGFDLAYCLRGGETGVTADYWDNDYFVDPPVTPTCVKERMLGKDTLVLMLH